MDPRASPKVDGPAVLCPVGVGQGIHDKGYNKKPQKTCQFFEVGHSARKKGRLPREQLWRSSTNPPRRTPLRNKGLIFGLIKGNQWVFISPDHKALCPGGGGTFTSGIRLDVTYCNTLVI